MTQGIQTKDLKVRLPMSYHMKLQTLKILKGKNMSAAFCEALDMYFSDRPESPEPDTSFLG
ncbi:MAG: hypothetical protein WDA16_03770 [Candidatus Thermoplasmatota archaeon]